MHDTSQYANKKIELLRRAIRVRERGMWLFKSIDQAQRFLTVHAVVYNLFNFGMASAPNYRNFREVRLTKGEKR